MDEPLRIVLVGDIVDGFEAFGPFESWALLQEFRRGEGDFLRHVILDLTAPPQPPAQDDGEGVGDE